MKIKVLHIIDHLGYGGAQRSVKEIVENISDGYETAVCALRSVEKPLSMNIDVHTLQGSKFSIMTLFRVLKLCRRIQPDIIHTHLSKSHIFSLLLKNHITKPVVMHLRGTAKLRTENFALRRFFLYLSKRADIIVANSHYTAAYLINTYKNMASVRVIYNAIDFDAIEKGTLSRASARVKLGIKKEAFIVGYIGRLHKIKGVDILIEAMAYLGNHDSQFIACIVGCGPERDNLKRLAESLCVKDKVFFAGHYDKINQVVPAFDVAVVPSRQESFGRVAIELMRLKVPVIASDAGGLKEIVENEITGLSLNTKNANAYALAILKLYNDPDLRKRLTANAYRFSSSFSIDKHVRQLERLYRDLARKA